MKTPARMKVRASGALLATAFVASCGGGGGGGGNASSVDYLPLTAANAFFVSSTVVQGVGAGFDVIQSNPAPTNAQAATAAAGYAARRALSLSQRVQARALSPAPLAAFGPETEPCEMAGTVTFSGSLADPFTLSVGDRITADFDACDDDGTYVLDGTLSLVIRAVQGDPLSDVYLVRTDATVSSLGITQALETYVADGRFTLTIDNLAFPETITRMQGSKLSMTRNAERFDLLDFDQEIRVEIVDTIEYYVSQAIGTLVTSLFDGQGVDYETAPPLESGGDTPPDTGEILITGAAGSAVHVVMMGAGSVQLQTDENGDGTIDAVEDTTWQALNGDDD